MPVKGSHKYVREEELNINISIFPILKYLIAFADIFYDTNW